MYNTRQAPFHPVERQLALRFDTVSFSYASVTVFSELSFHIHEGEFIALVGPNGTGKTTILKLLLGLLTPQHGTIELFGTVFRSIHSKDRDKIGYVPQAAPADLTLPISVRNVVRMGRLRPFIARYRRADREACEAAMEQADIADLADRSYSGLSGGQRRRVLVARALASCPRLLILDEPTANMDTQSEERLFKSLSTLKGRTTILIVTHNVDFVSSLIDRVLCLGASGETTGVIVQHRLELPAAAATENVSPHGNGASRVLHDQSIPGDRCLSAEEEKSN
ncbi:metal ABC transporter ATP-binding protein [Breznakiellaceae bacterium SP9]